MAQFAEKLSLLLGIGDTVLARLHKVKQALSNNTKKPQFLLDPAQSKLIASAVKRFPELTDVSGFDTVLTAANEHYAELEDYYYTFVDTMQFKSTTCTVIEELTNAIASFQFDKNPVLTEAFLELTALLIRSLLLMASITDRKVVVSIFAKLYTKQTSGIEDSWSTLGTFITQYDQPVRALQKELKEAVSQSLGHALIDLMNPLVAGHNVDQLRKAGVLSVSNKPNEMCFPLINQSQLLVRLYPKIYSWVVFGFLLTPEQFAMPEPMEILKIALQQSYVVPLYQNEVCYIHAEYEQLFASYKTPNKQLSKQLKKDKKSFGEALAQATQPTLGPKYRADRRNFIRHELQQLVLLIKDYPGLLGPKIEVIWGILSLAKEEVFWYFAQKANAPPKSSSKGITEKLYTDPYISQLIYYIEEMANVIRQYKYIVQQYYIEYLSGADYKQASQLIEKLKSKGATGRVAAALDSIIADLQSVSLEKFNEGFEYSFVSLRLNWFRVETWLVSPGCPAGDINSNIELSKRMNLIMYHTKNVDAIDYLIWDFSSLHGLVHFPNSCIQTEFDVCLSSSSCISFISTWIQLVSTFPEAVTSSSLEEKPKIGARCVELANQFISKIASKIGTLIATITNANIGWQSQLTDPVKVASLVKTEEVEGLIRHSVSTNVTPGDESRPKSGKLDDVREAENHLSLICAALRNLELVYVYNNVLSPYTFIRDEIMAGLKEFILKNLRIPAVDKEGTITVQRPSVLLQHIRHYQTAILNMNYFTLMDTHSIIQQTLSELTYHPMFDNENGNAWVLADPHLNAEKYPLLAPLVELYTDFVSKRLDSGLMIFSRARQSFVSKTPVKIDEYCNLHEFAALAQLIGPRGIQLIDRNLLQLIYRGMDGIKEHLQANQEELDEFSTLYTTVECIPLARKIQNVEGFMMKAVSIGNALVFRRLLYNGVKASTQRYTPSILRSVETLFDLYDKNIYGDEGLINGDIIAQLVGIDVGLGDAALVTLIKSHTEPDPTLWNLLPFAFGCGIFSQCFTTSTYKCALDAFTNNAHVLVESIYYLVILTKSTTSEDEFDVIKQETICKFIEVSSIIILRLLRIDAKKLQKNLPFTSLPSVCLFLDLLMERAEGITKDVLDNIVPYALLRSLYRELYISEPENAVGANN